MSFTKALLVSTAASGALVGFFPAPAMAQRAAAREVTDTTDVGEVVVTARRREERLRDVPVAASVVDAALIQARGDISDPQAVLNNVPGVKFFDTSSPSNSEVTIRGSGQARGTGSEASASLYRNDVYVGGGQFGGRTFNRLDLLDVEQVQVLRGPQGALYGRNSTGGAMHIISAKPVWAETGFVNTNYQFDTQLVQVQTAVNHAVSDTVAVRLAGEWLDQYEGSFLNASNGKYLDGQDGYGVRGQIRLKKGALDATLLAEDGLYHVPSLRSAFNISPGTTGFPLGLIGNKYVYRLNTSALPKQRSTFVALSAQYTFDFGVLSSTSGFRHRKSQILNDNDGFDATSLAAEKARGNATTVADAFAGTNNNERYKLLYQDLHLAGNEVNGVTWLVGGEILTTTSNTLQVRGRSPTRANPSTGTKSPVFATYDSWAVYGSLGYSITEALNLQGDLRYTHDKKYRTGASFDALTNVKTNTRDNTGTETFENLSYALSLSYHVSENWLTYARVSSGYRAGGLNGVLGDPRAPRPAPETYGPELATAYEVGAKGNILPNIYATVAGYVTKAKDVQIQQDDGCAVTNPMCPVASTAYLLNGGRATLWGIEVELNGRWEIAGGNLRVSANGSRQDGKVDDGPLANRTLPQNPEWIWSANLDYRHRFVADSQVYFNLNYSGQSGGIQEIDGNIPLSDREIVDLRVGVSVGRIDAAFYSSNVFDESYVVFVTATQNRWSTPRHYGVQLRYRW